MVSLLILLRRFRSVIIGRVRHNITVQPVYQRASSPDLRCEVRRTVAYRAKCSCGWLDKARSSVQAARISHREHTAEVEGTEPERVDDGHLAQPPIMEGGIP